MTILKPLPVLFFFLLIITIGLTACDEASDKGQTENPVSENTENPATHFYKGVHPLCIYKLANDGGQDSVNLDECTAADIEVTDLIYDKDKNQNMASFQYGDDTYPARGMSGYRYVGSNADGDILETFWNGGGSGTFTNIMAVTVKDGVLTVNKRYAGGDRCNGGVADVGFTPDDTLYYKQHMTPYDMITVGRTEYSETIEPYEDIDDCAACCYGLLETRNNQPYAVYLADDLQNRIEKSGDDISLDTMQACLDRHLHGQEMGVKHKWTFSDWAEIQDRIYKDCF